MRCTDHIITAPFAFGSGELEATISYRFFPGHPGSGPTYDCGGEPPEPDQCEVQTVTIPGLTITGKAWDAVLDWAQDYLDHDGHDATVDGLLSGSRWAA